jgi:hypothetical protein
VPTNGSMAVQEACGPVYAPPPSAVPQHLAVLGKFASERGRSFLVAGFLIVSAACLSVGVLAFIAAALFDADLGLLAFGGEDIIIAPHHEPVACGQSVGAFSAPQAIICFVITVGAYLVLRHRARSALATDSPCICITFNVAEPWGGT